MKAQETNASCNAPTEEGVYLSGIAEHPLTEREAAYTQQNPESNKNLGAAHPNATYDTEKTLRIIVDKLVDIDYELLGLISTDTKMLHCVCYSAFEQNMQCGTDVRYPEGMAEFVERYAVDNKDDVRAGLSFDTIVQNLQSAQTYSCSYSLELDGKKMHKKWQFAYLDESKASIILVRSDISQLFEQQQQQKEVLRDALAMAERASLAKSDFLSRMSHEIRTPMNVIIGMASLASKHVDDPVQMANFISKIGISARFLLSLINDILDMSAIESGKVTIKKESIPFEEFLNSINSIAYETASNKSVDFDCILSSPLEDDYIGDAMKLQQIILNLISNAIKFTPEGGKVQLMVEQSWTNHKKAHLRFTINDTGVGIKEEFMPKLFDAFEQGFAGNTTPYGGTGLGLAIAKNLATMMGGTITVNSIENIGSEFTFDVTLERGTRQSKISELKSNNALENLSVLVVDDEISICEYAEQVLADMGMKAAWVNSGLRAINLVQEKWDRNENFDMILIDWKMPEMDGIETTRAIRRIVGPDVTIIIITAYDWESIEEEAKQAGVNLLISKPLFKSSLYSAFEMALGSKEQKPVAPEQPAEYNFVGKRVLLVEDHILNVEVVKNILEAERIEVDTAENGLIAIEKFAKVPPYYYDAILMDIRMPVMDGLTAARSIRQLQNEAAKTVPIIALSANAFDEDVDKSLAAGMNAHLGKPVEPDSLYRTLSYLLDQD